VVSRTWEVVGGKRWVVGGGWCVVSGEWLASPPTVVASKRPCALRAGHRRLTAAATSSAVPKTRRRVNWGEAGARAGGERSMC
jgi:hypothetical protein